MEVVLKTYRFAWISTIGEINQAKIDRLAPSFKDRYPIIGKQNNGPGAIFVNPEEKKSIVFEPNRILFDYNGDDLALDLDTLESDLKNISTTLILDNNGPGSFSFIANVLDTNGDSMATTSNILSVDNVIGLGLRFFFKNNQDIWEFKLEPMISDSRYFYLEAICNYSTVDANQVRILAEEAYSFFKSTTNDLLENSLLFTGRS